ncbi:hypothetical protein [Nocardia brasiliensis]|uniref:hypothetical protein n=1 Tax=Nocardia brasiliensis TaxID=37326 RepID=UPI0024554CF9|nr:hypothetical protein [Nocardia brasiliensis]
MEYDSTDNELAEFMRDSPELRQFLQAVADQGAERWEARSRRRTGFNATHVEAYVEPGESGEQQGVVYASGHYARYREHGTRWNRPEHVMRDFKDDVEG